MRQPLPPLACGQGGSRQASSTHNAKFRVGRPLGRDAEARGSIEGREAEGAGHSGETECRRRRSPTETRRPYAVARACRERWYAANRTSSSLMRDGSCSMKAGNARGLSTQAPSDPPRMSDVTYQPGKTITGRTL